MKKNNVTNQNTFYVMNLFYDEISALSPSKQGEEIKNQDRLFTEILTDKHQQVAIICNGVSFSPNGDVAAEYVVNKAATLFQEKGIQIIVQDLLELRTKLLNTPIYIDEQSNILKDKYQEIIKENYRTAYQTTLISIRLSWNDEGIMLSEVFGCGDSALFIFTDQGELLYNNLNLLNSRDNFKHTRSHTEVLPDNFDANNILLISKQYPPNTQFLLCSDGFYDGFSCFQEIFNWLNKNQKGLLQPDIKERLLVELHQKLSLKKGDDDISLIWLYPKKSEKKRHLNENSQREIINRLQAILTRAIGLFPQDAAANITAYPTIKLLIVIIAILATISGISITSIMLSSELLAVCCGLLCGLCVYGINQFMITNTILQRINRNNNNLPLIRLDSAIRSILTIFPNIIISMLLVIIISIPIELKLFEAEIKAEIIRYNYQLTISAENHMKQRLSEIDTLEEQNENYRREIEKSGKRLTQLRQQLLMETTVNGKAGQPDRINFQQAKEEVDTYEAEMKKNTTRILMRIEVNNQRIYLLRSQLNDHEMSRYSLESRLGLLGQLSTLSELTKKEPVIYWLGNSMILLILFIQLTPIVFLTVSSSGKQSILEE